MSKASFHFFVGLLAITVFLIGAIGLAWIAKEYTKIFFLTVIVGPFAIYALICICIFITGVGRVICDPWEDIKND